MGRYLDFLRSRREEDTYDRNDRNDKTAISTAYERPKGGTIYDRSPLPGGGADGGPPFGRSGDPPSVAANPLKNKFCRFGRFGRTFSELERRCPAHVDLGSWRQTVEDGCRFLAQWGEQAEALNWSPADLFGLAPVPEKPAANYRRLSRYDETGLLWLLHGRPVVALTDTTAAIQCPTGAIVTYRRHDKPALGPLGDSLEDFA
jgi:hypothetical protein